MYINDRLEQCEIKEITKNDLENWQKNDPMCVMCSNIPEDMEDGPIYKCWVYYSDGWGCFYANLVKYEKITENG